MTFVLLVENILVENTIFVPCPPLLGPLLGVGAVAVVGVLDVLVENTIFVPCPPLLIVGALVVVLDVLVEIKVGTVEAGVESSLIKTIVLVEAEGEVF